MHDSFLKELIKIASADASKASKAVKALEGFKRNKRQLAGLTTITGRGLNVLGGIGGATRGAVTGALNLARGHYSKKRKAFGALARGARKGYRVSREYNRLGALSSRLKQRGFSRAQLASRAGANQMTGAAVVGGGTYLASRKRRQ